MYNFRKFLAVLDECSSNRTMIKACRDAGLEQLGKGSSRIVFALNSTKVIKIALNEQGKKQNEEEARLWLFLDYDRPVLKQYYAKVFIEHAAHNDLYSVQERLEKVSKKDAQPYVDAVYTNKAQGHPKNLVAAIKHVDDTLGFCTYGDINKGNLGRSKRGSIKVLDYGLPLYLAKQYRAASFTGNYFRFKAQRSIKNI